MQIVLATSVGQGPTALAAFDEALHKAGVANYNLLRLSSVIPPSSTLIEVGASGIPPGFMPGAWGDRLYVVMAEQREDRHNAEAWAGIGWVQDPETGQGLFVEHEGSSEAMLRRDIEQSLEALMHTRGVDFGRISMAVVGAPCLDTPTCALAVAVYQSSDWDNNPAFLTARAER